LLSVKHLIWQGTQIAPTQVSVVVIGHTPKCPCVPEQSILVLDEFEEFLIFHEILLDFNSIRGLDLSPYINIKGGGRLRAPESIYINSFI
jgi:hypothetical protein